MKQLMQCLSKSELKNENTNKEMSKLKFVSLEVRDWPVHARTITIMDPTSVEPSTLEHHQFRSPAAIAN